MVLDLADQLKHALANYTESGGQGDPTYDTRQAFAIMLEKQGIACDRRNCSVRIGCDQEEGL